jgi:hypothetical protein
MVSMKINVILIALGSFLFGADWGILIYDSYWGFGDLLYKPSVSLNVTSTVGAPFYALFGAIGVVLLFVGCRNVLLKRP